MNFSNIERTIFGFWTTNFRQGCQNCILFVQRNVLRAKYIFFSKFNFIIFTVGIVKNGFYDTIGAIFKEKRECVYFELPEAGEKTNEPVNGKANYERPDKENSSTVFIRS